MGTSEVEIKKYNRYKYSTILPNRSVINPNRKYTNNGAMFVCQYDTDRIFKKHNYKKEFLLFTREEGDRIEIYKRVYGYINELQSKERTLYETIEGNHKRHFYMDIDVKDSIDPVELLDDILGALGKVLMKYKVIYRIEEVLKHINLYDSMSPEKIS